MNRARGQTRRGAVRRAKRQPDVRLPALSRPKKRAWFVGALAAGGIVLGSAVILGDVPGMAWRGISQSVARVGLVAEQVEIVGATHTRRIDVHQAVLPAGSNSMLDIDLEAARKRVAALPWVADVSIQRALPNRLIVTLQERAPFAIWRTGNSAVLVDAKGTVLTATDLIPFAGLPILVGAGAATEAARLWPVLATQPQLHARVTGAAWIGRRRWDIRFDSGEILALPEGYDNAQGALARFARMESGTGLLDRGFARFDMRIGDRLVVRRASDKPDLEAKTPSSTPQSGLTPKFIKEVAI